MLDVGTSKRAARGGRRWLGPIAAAALVALASAAQADDMSGLAHTPAHKDAYAYERVLAPSPWDRAVGVVLSLGSVMLNTAIFPAKLAVGVGGAAAGGAAGFLTGGDLEAAAGVWNVTTDGAYGTTPARLDGRDAFLLGSDIR